MPRKREMLGESLEDYAEAILELEEKDGVARVTEIAGRLSVSKPSVTEALGILKEKGIVDWAPYKPIRLTARGRKVAKEVRARHEVLYDFLTKVLKVDPERAQSQACRMEHILEPHVIDRLCQLAFYLGTCPNSSAPEWREGFGFVCGEAKGSPECEKCRFRGAKAKGLEGKGAA